MTFGVIWHGVEEAQSFMAKLMSGGEAATGTIGVGTTTVYAYGIEEGVTRGGKLARRAGGAHYLRRALETTAPKWPEALAKALPKGEQAVNAAQKALAEQMTANAKEYVPVKTGALQRSLHAIYRGAAAEGPGDPLLRRATPAPRNRLAAVRRRRYCPSTTTARSGRSSPSRRLSRRAPSSASRRPSTRACRAISWWATRPFGRTP